MNVLHVIPAVAPRYGGPSAALPAMCAALRRRGVEVTIAATDADGEQRLPVAVNTATTYEGTRAIFFARQFSESFKYSRPLANWLAGNVGSFDLVHVHAVLSHACLAAGRACRNAHVPYIVRPLGTLDPWSLAQKALKKRLLLWAAGRRMLRNAAAIQYTSAREKRLVEASLHLRRGVVVPLGIAQDGMSGAAWSSRPADRPYVLALSRLHPKKRLEDLIAAFDRLSAEGRFCQWRLVIGGDGEPAYIDHLKRVAGGHDHDGAIEFTGWVEGERKRELLRRAALFAAPSFDENFGVSLVEALGSGVAVVVSDRVHLADEIAEAGAGWVVRLEHEQLEATLAEAMSSAAERERRGARGRDLAQRFAWPRVAQQLVDLYRQVANIPGVDVQV